MSGPGCRPVWMDRAVEKRAPPLTWGPLSVRRLSALSAQTQGYVRSSGRQGRHESWAMNSEAALPPNYRDRPEASV